MLAVLSARSVSCETASTHALVSEPMDTSYISQHVRESKRERGGRRREGGGGREGEREGRREEKRQNRRILALIIYFLDSGLDNISGVVKGVHSKRFESD